MDLADTNLPPEPAESAAPADAGAGQSFDDAFAEFSARKAPAAEPERAPPEVDRQEDAQETKAEEEHPADQNVVAGQPASDDIWLSADQRAKAAYEAAQKRAQDLEHQLRSDRGRIAAFQRAKEAAEAKLAALQKAGAAGPGGQQAGAADDDADIQALERDYPEIARPLLKELQSLKARNDELSSRFKQLDDQAQTELMAREVEVLKSYHPDYVEVTAKPEFFDWLNRQPSYVVEAVRRNGENIVNASEAADVIGRFKQSLQATQQPPAQGRPSATPQQNAVRRELQRESAVGVRSRGPSAAASQPPDDFEAAFQHYAARKQQGARRGA